MNKLITGLILIVVISCANIQESEIPEIQGNILLFNGLAETLSILDIDSESIYNNIKTTGIWPNHITTDTDLILVNSGDNTVSIMDIDTLETKKDIYLGSGKNPWMSFPVSNNIYVTCYLADEVIKINRNSGEKLTSIPVQKNPQGGAIVGNRLFIGNVFTENPMSSSISVIDLKTDKVEKNIPLPFQNPQTIIPFENRNEIHIVCTGINSIDSSKNDDGVIIIMDSNTFEIKSTINIGGSPVYSEGSINMDKKLVYLYGTTGISAYNYETNEIIDTAIDNIFISGLLYIPETNKIYASNFAGDSINIYKGDDYSYEKSVQTSDGPQQLLYIKK